MPSKKVGKEAQDWAVKLLQEVDEDREYERNRAAQQKGTLVEVGETPTKEAEDLVKQATEELNADAEHRHTPEFEEKFVNTWEGILADPTAIDAKGYVAKCFGDAIAHGPKGAWDKFKSHHDSIVQTAKQYASAGK